MLSCARTILWAQLRTLRNFYPRGNRTRMLVTVAMAAFWYGMWAVGAVAAASLLSDAADWDRLTLVLSHGLMAAMLYWQVIPILMVSAGAALDVKRLRIYPVPDNQMFGLEVLLRMTASVEVLIVLAGATAGLLMNPLVPFWAPLGFLPYVGMNLFLAAGLRNLLERVLARKYVRELAFLLLVSVAALPQVLIATGVLGSARQFITSPPQPWWPWSSGAAAVLGSGGVLAWVTAIGWMLIAYAFGRWQFSRGLVFDTATADVRRAVSPGRTNLIDKLYRIPSVMLPDPLAALVEKEIRSLIRSPRFRVVFVMGFTFGLIIWLPIAIRGRDAGGSFFTANYLTFVSLYALLLLGEVSFWNAFGFDRSATRLYYLLGISPARVLVAKNLVALLFVCLEVTAVALACALLRMPITVAGLVQSYLVVFVLALYMLAAGNLGSTHYPRAVDPRQSWRSTSASRFQAMLLLIYPVIALPVILAFLARYAFDSVVAFYLALAVAALLGGIIYKIAMDSAVNHMENECETMLARLSEGEGPVAT